MNSIRLISLAAVVVGAATLAACGNSGVLALGGKTGSSGMSAEQAAAIDQLEGHWCQTCEVPAGGAHVLEVGIMPADYTGGPLELTISYVDPNGVVDASGASRVEKTLTINDVDMLAGVPAEAWKVSTDGVRARIRFEAVDGLPAGDYVVRASITDPDLGSADSSRTFSVAAHEPTPTATPHEPTPTATPHEPTPTPTPEHTPTPAPTPAI